MERVIPIESAEETRALLGIKDCNARLLRAELAVSVTVRNGGLRLEGEEEAVNTALRVVGEALARYRRTGVLDREEVAKLVRAGAAGPAGGAAPASGPIVKSRLNRDVLPRTARQAAYVRAMEQADVVFAVGPAGTGKTYLAVAMAVRMLRRGGVKRIILTRPVVEAGESLGYLPGTFEAKINPFLRPLYDALYDMLDGSQIRKFMENDLIEVAPLAYMRGRTLADAFIILDEAQNTTIGQMKMFLTRMGEGSRMVVTGDITQIDLPDKGRSGLVHATKVLRSIAGVTFVTFGKSDIVRHPVVERIVAAYERRRNH